MRRYDPVMQSCSLVFFLHFNVRTIQYGPNRHLSYKAPEATVSQGKNADDDKITNTHP